MLPHNSTRQFHLNSRRNHAHGNNNAVCIFSDWLLLRGNYHLLASLSAFYYENVKDTCRRKLGKKIQWFEIKSHTARRNHLTYTQSMEMLLKRIWHSDDDASIHGTLYEPIKPSSVCNNCCSALDIFFRQTPTHFSHGIVTLHNNKAGPSKLKRKEKYWWCYIANNWNGK